MPDAPRPMLDVAVLGGGIIGCAIARELARSGLKVAVFERRRIGGESSGAAAGMLGVEAERKDDVLLELARESRRRYPALLEALREETGIAVEFWQAGTLYLAFNAADEHMLASRRGCEGGRGEPLAPKEVWAREPAVNRRVRGGMLYRLDGRVDNVALTAALARATVAAGGVIREGEDVKAVVAERSAISAIITGRERVPCGVVINALGAWAARVRGVTPLPVRPVRGQIVVAAAARPPFRHAVYSARGYAVTRRDGRVLLGSTLEDVGFDKRVTAGGVAAILAAAAELSPRLRELPICDAWAGLRPASSDGRPIIGADPAVRGYYVATGHFRDGVLLAPLTAHLIAALVRGERHPWQDVLGLERLAGVSAAHALTV